jgi:capsular polysaccharide biosynthesis protein
MDSNFELDLKSLFSILKKNAWIITIVSLIGLIGAFLYTNFFVDKMYTSDILLIFNSETFQSSSSQSTSKTEASRKMAETYTIVLKYKSTLQKVADRLGVSVGTVANAISITQQNETEILKISATTRIPELSADICNTIAAISSDIIQEVTVGGSVKAIGQADIPRSPSSPSVSRNSILGFLIGFILSSAVIVIKNLMDNTVNVEDDVSAILGVAVLGEVPSFEEVTEKKGKGEKE